MKRLFLLLAVAATAVTASVPAASQVRFGIKAGVCVNKLHHDKSTLDGDNRTGFTGGVMLDGRIPLLGFAFDGSLMYVRRNATSSAHADYFTVPVNLKYRISIPVISKVVTPFLTTGPEWSYVIDHKSKGYDINKSNFSWNFGFGAELLSHVQLAASYGLALGNSYESKTSSDAKNRYWTLTAAYLF